MKLVMTLLVRDEEDVITANIDFHLAMGVDYFIVTDNLSSDKTSEILREYQKRGVLRYIFEPEDTYAQHRWVTRMARIAAVEFGADWVINNDADEFWYPDNGDLKSILLSLDPAVEAVSAPRTNFVPLKLSSDIFFLEEMTIRERMSLNALGKPLPDKVCHRAAKDIEVAQGNHSVSRGGARLRATPAQMSVLHFPMRSYAQFENKIAKGGAAYERNIHLKKETGETWRFLYELWRRGELQTYFLEQVPDPSNIERRLANGQYVRDERLKHFFQGLQPLAHGLRFDGRHRD